MTCSTWATSLTTDTLVYTKNTMTLPSGSIPNLLHHLWSGHCGIALALQCPEESPQTNLKGKPVKFKSATYIYIYMFCCFLGRHVKLFIPTSHGNNFKDKHTSVQGEGAVLFINVDLTNLPGEISGFICKALPQRKLYRCGYDKEKNLLQCANQVQKMSKKARIILTFSLWRNSGLN